MSRIRKFVQLQTEESLTIAVTPSIDLPPEAEAAQAEALFPADEPPPPVQETIEVLMAQVQLQIETMLEEAHQRVALLHEEAQREGWQSGYEEGRAAAHSELAEALQTSHALAQSAVESRQHFLDSQRNEMGRLAVAITEKLIGRALAIQPEIIADVVGQAVEAASKPESCRIRLHPKDHEVLKAHWHQQEHPNYASGAWELVPDKRITRGGCLIEADGGIVDAQLETQLQQVQSAFDEMAAS